MLVCTKKLLRIARPLLNPPWHHSVALRERWFLFPRFVLHDEKLFTTMLTRRGGEEDRTTWPKKYSLLFTVGTSELVSIETRTNSRHMIPMRSIGSDARLSRLIVGAVP